MDSGVELFFLISRHGISSTTNDEIGIIIKIHSETKKNRMSNVH